MMTGIFALLTACLTTLAVTPLVRRIALRAAILDCPDGRRKLQSQPVPLLGGVAVLAGWWAALAVIRLAGSRIGLPPVAMPASVALTLLAGIGVLDDVFRLCARWKILGQVFAVMPLVMAGCRIEHLALGGYSLDLGPLSAPVTLFWLLLGINSLNLLDGMDGMATVISTSIALTLGVVCGIAGQHGIALVMLSLAGALLGFLVFNFPPARIYLGDAGSMVLGLALSLATLLLAKADSHTTQLTTLLAIMAIPVADTMLAILRRSLSGRGFWHPDRGHIHHRLLDQGLNAKQVLFVFVPLAAIWGSVVVMSAHWHAEWPVWSAAVVAGVFSIQIHLAGQHEWTMLTRLLARLEIAHFSLPTQQQLLAMPFEAAWQSLLDRTRALPIVSVSMTVEEADGTTSEKSWTAPEASPDRSALEVHARSTLNHRCRLRIEATELAAGAVWSRLPQLLDCFARFWAEHPEAIDTAVLPFETAVVAVPWSGAQSPDRQQKQAA